MNLRQIEYFLTVAQCLSFSESAKRLFMTQPALGRQIRALEDELGVALFIRGKRALELTPAGAVLYEEFGRWLKEYNGIIEKAQLANSQVTNTLEIGILEGHQLGALFPAIYGYFKTNYPQIQVNTHRMSFSPLIQQLYQGDVDIIVTLNFDVEGRPDIEYRVIADIKNYLAVPATHPLAHRENLHIADFRDDVFIVNSPEDTRAGHNNLVDCCHDNGFSPELKLAATLDEYMLFVEIGYGVTVLSEHSMLRQNPNIAFISVPEVTNSSLVVAWLHDNMNPARQAFTESVELLIKKNSPK